MTSFPPPAMQTAQQPNSPRDRLFAMAHCVHVLKWPRPATARRLHRGFHTPEALCYVGKGMVLCRRGQGAPFVDSKCIASIGFLFQKRQHVNV